MTLFSDVSTISEEVSIDYDENKVATYDDYCDETYDIKSIDDYIYKSFHDLQAQKIYYSPHKQNSSHSEWWEYHKRLEYCKLFPH